MALENSSIIKKGVEFALDNAAYCVRDNYSESMLSDGVVCTVSESDGKPPLNSEHAVPVAQVKTLILEFLESLSTNT